MKSGLEWGKARMEFLAILPEVTKLLQEGCSKRQAFHSFVKDGRISMSYPRFCQLAGSKRRETKAIRGNNSKVKGKAAAVSVTQPSASTQVPVPQSTVEATATPQEDKSEKTAKKGPIVIGGEKKPGFADVVITDDQIF